MPELPSNLEVFKRVPLRFHLVVAQKANRKIIERFIGSREIDDTSTHRFPTLERMRKDYAQARIALSSNCLTLHRRLVLKGYGSSVLPAYLIGPEIRTKKLRDVYPRERFFFDLKVVIPKGEPLSKAAQAILDQLVRTFN